MAIEINENVLLTIAGVIFVPIFVFLIKMIMEVANIRTKLDIFDAHIEETRSNIKKVSDFGYEIRAIKTSLSDIDDDLKYLFSTVHHDPTDVGGGPADTYGSRRTFRKRGVRVEGGDQEEDDNGGKR